MRWVAIFLIVLAVFTVIAYNMLDKQQEPVYQEKKESIPTVEFDNNNPNVVVLEQTDIPVISEEDAIAAYEKFVLDNNKDWEFHSITTKTVDGKEYYEVTYRHFELSGGKRRVLIDSDGGVHQEFPTLG